MRPALRALCLTGLALASLAGCGGDDDDDAEASGSGSGSGPGSPTAPGGDYGGGGGGAASEITVGALDSLEFDSSAYEAAAGEVTFVYENEGNLPHTLLIDGIDGFKLSVGDTDEGSVELEPGTYTLYCDVAGHRAGGMEAELTVE